MSMVTKREYSWQSTGEHYDVYGVLTALVVPRPIAWITTVDADGIANAAPFSFFSVASEDPPVLSVSFIGEKDTLRNLRATKECVVNLASEPMASLINATGANHPADIDELAHHGIATQPSVVVACPRIAEAPASLECVLHDLTQVGNGTVAFLRVVHCAVSEAAFETDNPDGGSRALPQPHLLRPVSRLGGDQWGLPPATFTLKRPRWTAQS